MIGVMDAANARPAACGPRAGGSMWLSNVIALLDRAIQYSRAASDPISLGVLDTPHARGMTPKCGARLSPTQNPPPLAQSACHEACGRRHGPRRRGSGAAALRS